MLLAITQSHSHTSGKGWGTSNRKMIEVNVDIPVATSATEQSERRNRCLFIIIVEAERYPWYPREKYKRTLPPKSPEASEG